MNRKMLAAIGALLLLLAIKYAFGQEDTGGIGWEPVVQPAPDAYIFVL